MTTDFKKKKRLPFNSVILTSMTTPVNTNVHTTLCQWVSPNHVGFLFSELSTRERCCSCLHILNHYSHCCGGREEKQQICFTSFQSQSCQDIWILFLRNLWSVFVPAVNVLAWVSVSETDESFGFYHQEGLGEICTKIQHSFLTLLHAPHFISFWYSDQETVNVICQFCFFFFLSAGWADSREDFKISVRCASCPHISQSVTLQLT